MSGNGRQAPPGFSWPAAWCSPVASKQATSDTDAILIVETPTKKS
jgi:hypothetical protein